MRRFMASLFSPKPAAIAKRPAMRRWLQCEQLEDRLTPAGFFLTGVGGFTNPAEPNARVYDTTQGGSQGFLQPPGDIGTFPGFSGSVRVANGDVNNDGIDDIITAQGDGAGSGSQIRIFDGSRALFGAGGPNNAGPGDAVEIASFFAYSNVAGAGTVPGFGGGVFVASADINGDGFDELVTSPGAGARGHVKVFDFNNGGVFAGNAPILRSSFFAYTDFAGEIRVSMLNANGVVFLITGSGAGTSQSDVRGYNNAFTIGEIPDGTFVAPANQIFPFAGFNGGVSVAAGDTDNDGFDELFVSQNAGGTGLVNVYRTANLATPLVQFTAFGGFVGEVRLGAADTNGDGRVEVLTSTGSSPGAGGAHVKAWGITGGTANELQSFFAYEGYINGVFLSTKDFAWGQNFFNTTPINLTDGTAVFTNSTITVDTRSFVDLRPRTVTVALNITNLIGSENEDLDVRLVSPNGTTLELFDDVNPGGDGFLIILSDAGATALSAGTPGANNVVTTGTFQPEFGVSLDTTFGAAGVGGTWTLQIRDDAAGDTYKLTAWALSFTF